MAFIFVKRVIVYLKTCGNLTGLIDNKKGFFYFENMYVTNYIDACN